jgi:hypothetical protein
MVFLSEIRHNPVEEIKNELYETHLKWKGSEEQVFDILVIGIRI